jgi:hypothetical protein
MSHLADTAKHRGACRQRTLTSVLALYLIGCGAARPEPVTVEDIRGSTVGRGSEHEAFRDLKVDSSAKSIQLECDHAAYEECNAVDDDCNGVIDDECGYEGGEVQITVGWNSGADIDLYVTDPSGSTLYYNERHNRSKIGGHLDHDARGDCRKEQPNPRIENAYWPAPARAGTYGVELHYFSPCAHGAATEVTLTVVVDRELVGTYRYTLEPEERIKALSFVKR